jgi:hypothetical protein
MIWFWSLDHVGASGEDVNILVLDMKFIQIPRGVIQGNTDSSDSKICMLREEDKEEDLV